MGPHPRARLLFPTVLALSLLGCGVGGPGQFATPSAGGPADGSAEGVYRAVPSLALVPVVTTLDGSQSVPGPSAEGAYPAAPVIPPAPGATPEDDASQA